MKVCLINIGNTFTEICDGSFNDYTKLPTSTLCQESVKILKSYTTCYTASVVPAVIDSLRSLNPDKTFYVLSAEKVKMVDFSKSDSTTIGADRLANLFAARKLFGPDVLILDCGTCVTAELLVQGVFHGGFIMPGRKIQRNALSQFTGQLPAVDLSRDQQLLGSNTVDSIKVGIDTMSSLALAGWVEKVLQLHPGVEVCFTGGDREFFSNQASFEFSISENLTLQGLKLFSEAR